MSYAHAISIFNVFSFKAVDTHSSYHLVFQFIPGMYASLLNAVLFVYRHVCMREYFPSQIRRLVMLGWLHELRFSS